jgi:hypothetical protein
MLGSLILTLTNGILAAETTSQTAEEYSRTTMLSLVNRAGMGRKLTLPILAIR